MSIKIELVEKYRYKCFILTNNFPALNQHTFQPDSTNRTHFHCKL